MRFIQKEDRLLEIHPDNRELPLPLAALGIVLVLSGLIIFFTGYQDSEGVRAAFYLLSLGGLALFVYSVLGISKYKFFYFTHPEEELWQKNLIGTYKVKLEKGGIKNIKLSIEAEEDLSARYEVRVEYSSGKSYTIDVADDDQCAGATADILSCYFDKEIIREVPDSSAEEIDADRFGTSLYERLKVQYPNGIPRRELPPVDFVTIVKSRYRQHIKLLYPPKSVLYHCAQYFLMTAVITALTIVICAVQQIAAAVIIAGAGIVVFLIINSIENGSFEDIIITPEALNYHRHHITAELIKKVPLTDIKMIYILPSTGYKIQRMLPRKKEAEAFGKPVERAGGKELFILTDESVIGIESWLDQEMAEYLKYLIEDGIYVLQQKGERDDAKTTAGLKHIPI